jgi:hypothetical protein
VGDGAVVGTGDVVDKTVLGHRPQRVAARTAQANEFPATTQLERETLREP